jgi:ABC-type Mn2+/Zn2+ transport system permease subunit
MLLVPVSFSFLVTFFFFFTANYAKKRQKAVFATGIVQNGCFGLGIVFLRLWGRISPRKVSWVGGLPGARRVVAMREPVCCPA